MLGDDLAHKVLSRARPTVEGKRQCFAWWFIIQMSHNRFQHCVGDQVLTKNTPSEDRLQAGYVGWNPLVSATLSELTD